MGILRLPLEDLSGVWPRGLNSLWYHLLWMKSCCCRCPPGWGSVCAVWRRDESCCLVSTPREGPALAGGSRGFVRCPHHWSPPRTAPGSQQEPAVSAGGDPVVSAACSTLSSGYHEQRSPNVEDKTLLPQSTPLLAEFYSSVIKTRGTYFWLRNRGETADPSEWIPFALLAPDQAP